MTGDFAKDLVGDQLLIAFLWKQDGSQASSIIIRKEIWLMEIGGNNPNLPPGMHHYPVFHLYNYVDPSKAHSPDSGCRVNPRDKPFLKLDDALALGWAAEEEAVRSGKWVYIEDVKSK